MKSGLIITGIVLTFSLIVLVFRDSFNEQDHAYAYFPVAYSVETIVVEGNHLSFMLPEKPSGSVTVKIESNSRRYSFYYRSVREDRNQKISIPLDSLKFYSEGVTFNQDSTGIINLQLSILLPKDREITRIGLDKEHTRRRAISYESLYSNRQNGTFEKSRSFNNTEHYKVSMF